MIWSRYSKFFKSKNNGWLLYNSASNSFFQIDEETVPVIKDIMKDPNGYDYSKVPHVYILLRNGGYIVEDSRDDDIYNIIKMKHLTSNYIGRVLLLTIAVTRFCNFDCSYCYEENRAGKPMSDEVEEKIVTFIKNHKNINELFITWYGGEPLLAMDRIKSFDKKIKELGKTYNAMIVTNGYLMTQENIDCLNDLNISRIQITLDGKKETHDSRRYLKNGGETFDKILENLQLLMKSDYKGVVQIRVNVDSRNEDEYIVVHNLIKNMFPDEFYKRIFVYPGFVKGDEHPDVSCFFDSYDKGEFVTKLAKEHGINALKLFPTREAAGCTLTKRNAYVVGTEGELYKCWDDVGIEELVVGHVDRFDNWNNALIAEGMVACSFLDSEECKNCFYFPVCDGGCHKARQKNLHDDCKRDCCTYFKDHLEDLLEVYYEQKMKKETERK